MALEREEKMGHARTMGPELQIEVERQLLKDITVYGYKDVKHLVIDWSESCIEGHLTYYLDGSVENFSGIRIWDQHKNLIGDGWIDFIHLEKENIFWVYWDLLELDEIKYKTDFGIPLHIWNKLPVHIQVDPEYKKWKQKNKPFWKKD